MSKYKKFLKEELMTLAEKYEGELASKKYGLMWDSERELMIIDGFWGGKIL